MLIIKIRGGYKKFNLIDLFEPVLAGGDLQAKKLEEGNIPLISSGHTGNGVCKYINNQYDKSNLFRDNLITVDMFGKAFYQPKPFYAVSHGRINILLPKFDLDEDLAMFFVALFNRIFTKKYAFNEMCSQTALKKEQIFLPVDKQGMINFTFMRDRIKSIKLKVNRKLKQISVA